MSATDQFETDLLELLFNNVEAPNIGDATGLENSTTEGSVQISLHTVALIDSDILATADEAGYANYVRQTVARNSGGFTVAGDNCSNAAAIQFPSSGDGPETEVHFGCCLMATGSFLQLHGDLTADLVVNSGVQPEFIAGALDFNLD